METSAEFLNGRKMCFCQSPDGAIFNTEVLENISYACALLIKESDEYWSCSWIESKEHGFYVAEQRRQGGYEALIAEIECIEFRKEENAKNSKDNTKDLHKRGSRRSFESTL